MRSFERSSQPLARAAAKSAASVAAVVALLLVLPATAGACSINAAGTCGGSACPKGETCKKTGDFECSCVSTLTLFAPGADEATSCRNANATLSALLGSSSEEIRLQAAIGLLDHGCSEESQVRASAGCVEPAASQLEACLESCRRHSPDIPECFDGCTEVFGAVLERCPNAANVTRNDCGDCLAECTEDEYDCLWDCRHGDPWDPSCYDDCKADCPRDCSPPCSPV